MSSAGLKKKIKIGTELRTQCFLKRRELFFFSQFRDTNLLV